MFEFRDEAENDCGGTATVMIAALTYRPQGRAYSNRFRAPWA